MPTMMESATQPFSIPHVEDFRDESGRHQQWLAPSEFGGQLVNSYVNAPPKKTKTPQNGYREKQHTPVMYEKQQLHPIAKPSSTETYGRPEDPWESSAEFKGDYSSVSHIVRRGSVGVKSVAKWAENFRSTPVGDTRPKPKWNSSLKRDVGWSQDPDEPRKQHYKKMMEKKKETISVPLAESHVKGETYQQADQEYANQDFKLDYGNRELTSRSTPHNPNAHRWIAPQVAQAELRDQQSSYQINNFPFDRQPAVQPRSGTGASVTSYSGVPWERRF